MRNNTTKIKLLRVVTQAEVVPWHLKNFIVRSQEDYQLFIVGNGVSKFKEEYPNVTFIDNVIVRKASFLYDAMALWKLIQICIAIKPDIVHSIMPKSGLLSSIAGFVTFVPIRIHTFTGQVWATKHGLNRKIFKSIDKFILWCNTQCLTDSPSQSNFLAKNGFTTKGNPIPHLGIGSLSGVDLDKFNINIVKDRSVLRKELGICENDFVYVYLARKSIIKGIIPLFESFSKVANLSDTKLLFIGPDESDGYLDVLYKEYNGIQSKIISLDIVKDHEKYLAISDVLCLPSSSEGFGSIVIEAAALGVPTIGFDIVGLSDSVVHDFSGILVPLNDVDALGDGMLSLYQDKNRLQTLKLNARERVLRYFSADVIYAFQNEFYKSLL